MTEVPLELTPSTPKVYVNGVETNWHVGKVAVWPTNRFARFIHRRILKRPPLRYIDDVSLIQLDRAPSGHVVVMYEIEN